MTATIENMKDNDSVDVLTENDTIVIKKSVAHRQHKTIKQRVEDFYGKDFETVLKENPYEYKEMTWGKSVGDEIW